MRRIMLCGAGSLGAAMAAKLLLLLEAGTRPDRKPEVLITDDTGQGYVSEITDGQLGVRALSIEETQLLTIDDAQLLTIDDAQLFVIGTRPPDFGFGDGCTLNAHAICEPFFLKEEQLPHGPPANYRRDQGRHTMSPKQQSLQAKARRR